MPIRSQCPVCESHETRLLFDGEDSLSLSSVGSSRKKLSPGRILRCKACGLAFRSFRPNPEELAELYRDADDTVYQAELSNRFKTAERHRRIVNRYQSQPGVLIDVGSGSGAFLRLMADQGWRVVGVEPSVSQCASAKAVLDGRGEIKQDVFERAELPSGVDLVTLWDVLEHVTDPVSFLRRSAGLLRSGGLLTFNVPHIDSPAALCLRSNWPLLLAEHLNYFTKRSLRLCAAKSELEVIRFGNRPVSFSLGYVSYRLSQHRLPGARAMSSALRTFGVEAVPVPVWMGEIYGVCRRK